MTSLRRTNGKSLITDIVLLTDQQRTETNALPTRRLYSAKLMKSIIHSVFSDAETAWRTIGDRLAGRCDGLPANRGSSATPFLRLDKSLRMTAVAYVTRAA